jgi:dihydroorotase
MKEIILNDPLDMHVHLRQGNMLRNIAKYTSKYFSGALVMPNTEPIITHLNNVINYKLKITEMTIDDNFNPYMTLYFQTYYDYDFLKNIKPHILAIKFYPKSLTTNTEYGCDPNDPKIINVLHNMEDLGIPLCIHAEANGYHENRERLFYDYIFTWSEICPKLKIIIEHISDAQTLLLVNGLENVYGTVTPHHLLLTGDDFVGPPLNPHNYCMPVCKTPHDREMLQAEVLNNKKLMLGTDSAPHLKEAKEQGGCAGIFNAPITLQSLVSLFENHLVEFQSFISDNAQKIYGIKPPKKQVTLIKKSFTVPDNYNGVVPLFAGKQLEWSIK